MLTRETVETTISKGFADKLDTVIVDISKSISFTRRQMVEDLGCANFLAAYRLQKVLKRLNITTPAKLFATDPFSLVRAKGIGEAAMFVAMCILAANKYSVTKWWRWDNTRNVKFGAYKHRATLKAKRRRHAV